MFTSQLLKDEAVLDDDYTEDNEIFVPPDGLSRGLELPVRRSTDNVYGAAASPFPESFLIPEADWEPMIKEMEDRKTRLSDLMLQAMMPVKYQAQTNYCWFYGPTGAVEVLRLRAGYPHVPLSAASGAAKIKNFRNVGGWGLEAISFLQDHGVVPESRWPNATISRSYDTPENWALAKRYRVEKWLELRPRNLKELMSCLLRRIPVAVGYNWWRHEVYLVDPVWFNGKPGGRGRNSWGPNWPNPGADGYFTLQGSKLLPDDAVAPLYVTAA